MHASRQPACSNSCRCLQQLVHLVLCGLQNYKETCKNIGYDCTTDEIYAECGNGKQGSAHMTAYPYSSFSDASFCEGNLANVDGALQCQLQQP